LTIDQPPTAEQAFRAILVRRAIAFVHMYDGRFAEATSWLERAMELSRTAGISDVTLASGLREPIQTEAAAWGDYDNDGRLDLFLNDFTATLSASVADMMGLPVKGGGHPRLYRNLGAQGFRDVSREVGLGRPIPAMSVICGDIDHDGFLDLHFGTGWMSYSGLIPDLTYRNVGGA
jgi:hypothetical protein